MSKLLKLTGLKSFTTPAFADTVVVKGQIIRVFDKLARQLEKGQKNGTIDQDPIPYWTEPTISEAGKVDHDFTAPKPTLADEPDEDPVEDAPAARKAPVKAPVRRGQR